MPFVIGVIAVGLGLPLIACLVVNLRNRGAWV